MAYRDYRNDRNDMACEIPLNDELLTSFSGRGRRRLRDLKQQTETVLKLDKNKSCLQVRGTEKSIADLRQHLETLIGHRRPISAPVWAELMRTRTQTTSDAAIQYIQEQSGCRVHIERQTHEVRLYGPDENLKVADRLLKELGRDTDLRVVEGMVSPQLLERVALSKGVTMRVRDTFIEVLGRTSATEEACAELEKLLERAEAEPAAAVEEAEISDPSAAAASHPESPKVSKDMGHAGNAGNAGNVGNVGNMGNMQTVQVMQGHRSERVENRCPTCGCGRFCGSCGAQIWQNTFNPVVNMTSMTSMASMTPMTSMTPMPGYVGYASGYTPAVPKDDSPTQTPDPAETADCGQTVMFPMFQMGQTPYMLMPADSGQMQGQWYQFTGQF